MASINSISMTKEGTNYRVTANVTGYKQGEECRFNMAVIDSEGVPRNSGVTARADAQGNASGVIDPPNAWDMTDTAVLVGVRIADMGRDKIVRVQAFKLDGQGNATAA